MATPKNVIPAPIFIGINSSRNPELLTILDSRRSSSCAGYGAGVTNS